MDGEYDLKVPRDMAYVFSGAYVPLSCRVIEQVRAVTLPPFVFHSRVVCGLSQLLAAMGMGKKRDSWTAAAFLSRAWSCLRLETRMCVSPGAGAAELAGPGRGGAAAQLQRPGLRRCVRRRVASPGGAGGRRRPGEEPRLL